MTSSNNIWAGVGNANTKSNNASAASTVIGGGPTPPSVVIWNEVGDFSTLPNTGMTLAPIDVTGPNGGYSYDQPTKTHYFDTTAYTNTNLYPNNAVAYGGLAVDLTNGAGLKYSDGTSVSKSDYFQVTIYCEISGFSPDICFMICDNDIALAGNYSTDTLAYLSTFDNSGDDCNAFVTGLGYTQTSFSFDPKAYTTTFFCPNGILGLNIWFDSATGQGRGGVPTAGTSFTTSWTSGGAPKLYCFIGDSVIVATGTQLQNLKYSVIKIS